MKRRTLLLAIPVLSACGTWTDDVAGPSRSNVPPQALTATGDQGLTDRYIVMFRDDVQNPSVVTDQLISQFGGTVHYRYAHAIKGFAATLPAAAVAGIRNNPMVSLIEADGIMSTTATQSNATWGLDRIDQRDRPLSGTYTYNQTGAGVTAYIIDTGIRYSHNEFGGRASFGFDVAANGTGNDCHGHGTHVAGTVGGTVYGVAKTVLLKAVRVLNCAGSGTTSGVIAGVDWVTANHVPPAVANMSLGGGASTSLDNAVNNAVAAGVTFAVAAGNSNANACNYSPARAASALTVGATTSSDARASYSNFGTCLDIFAPGSGITSAWSTSNTAINTISGTSMASPHVAGVAALYLDEFPGASPSTVGNAITSNATTGKVTSAGSGSPNRLLYSLFIGGGGGTQNNPPTSSFTVSCTDLTCNLNGSGSTDSDGTIQSYSWNFGDGTNGSGATTTKTYSSEGTRTVTLTVTDDDGATGSSSQSVTVTAPGGGGITLSAVGYKVKGTKHADLTWSGASSTNVDVFRDGAKITTTANDGAYTDNVGTKGGGSHTYRVCEAGTSTCSNSVIVSF